MCATRRPRIMVIAMSIIEKKKRRKKEGRSEREGLKRGEQAGEECWLISEKIFG